MDKEEILLKPTGSIQIVNRFTLIERKLLNGLIWHAQKNDFSSGENTMSMSDVMEIVGMPRSKNWDKIKDAIRTLTSTIVEWNYFGEDRHHEWGVCTFLSSGKIVSGGRLKYRLNPELVAQINKPTLFAKMQLLIQSQFRKRHSLVLYEFLVDSLCRKRSHRLIIPDVALERIHSLLGVVDAQWTAEGCFKYFNRDILKPSIAEINKHSDISVSCKQVRRGRWVVSITFVVELRENLPLPLPLDESISPDEKRAMLERTLSSLDTDDDDAGPDQSPMTVVRLRNFGITQRKAEELAERHGETRVTRNIDLIENTLRSGKVIDNIAAYLIRAIEDDYHRSRHESQAPAATSVPTAQDKPKQALEEEWRRFVSQRLREKYHRQSDQWKAERQQAYIEHLRTTNNTIFLGYYRKNGFRNPTLMQSFLAELRPDLLTLPEETSLEAYLAWRDT